MHAKHILRCLLLLALLPGWGEMRAEYRFWHYDRTGGMSDNTVNAIAQDYMGFIWIGTKYGLNRFDGRTFKVYRSGSDDYSLGSDYINALYTGDGKSLWVGTENGVYVYSPDDDAFERFTAASDDGEQIASNVKMISGTGSMVYFATESQGVFRYDTASRRFEHFPLQGFPILTSIAFAPSGRIWLGFFGGLFYSDDSMKTLKPYRDGNGKETFATLKVSGIAVVEKDELYVGTELYGVLTLNLGTGVVKPLLEGGESKDHHVHHLLYSQNEIWIATENGVYVYNMLSKETDHYGYEPTNPYSISDNPTQTVFCDKNGGMWIGTYFGGVNYAVRNTFVFDRFFPRVDIPGSIHGRRVRDIVEDKYGMIWVGTEDGGLNRYNPTKDVFDFVESSRNYHNIHGLCLSGDTLWVGSFSTGLKLIDVRNERLLKTYEGGVGPNKLYDNNIFTVKKLSGGKIYVGTLSGLYRYEPSVDGFRVVEKLPRNIVYDILEDRRGQMWVAVYGMGLYRRKTESDKWVVYSAKNEMHHVPSDNIISISETSDGSIWISTEGGGVAKYNTNGDSFEVVDVPRSNPRKVVFRIVEDTQRLLWMSTNDGLLCYNPKTGDCRVYTTNNGLLDNNFNYSSSLYSSDGLMYMGTQRGLVAFRPGNHSLFRNNSKIIATELIINNVVVDNHTSDSPLRKSILSTDKISLSHEQNTFAIKISTISFNESSSPHVEYMLEGFDDEWQDLYDNNYIKYTNLPSGHYTLRVRTNSADDNMSKSAYELGITIRKPFYLAWWMQVLYLLLACLAAYAAYRYMEYRSRLQRKIAMSKFEHEKEQELYQSKINFFTNVAHEIRTPLSLIKGPLELILQRHHGDEEEEDLTIMDQNVSRLLDLTNQLLDFRRAERDGLRLNFELSNISKLIERTFVRFQPLMRSKNISGTYQPPTEDINAYVDKEALTKIMSNLINNAVKYCEKTVVVKLTGDDDNFMVTCENDGPVVPTEIREKLFVPFFRGDTSSSGTGIGLALAHTLAELHGGELTMSPRTDVNEFMLTLPLRQSASLILPVDDALAVDDDNTDTVDNPSELPVVLIVEDNQTMLRYQRRVLGASYHVLTASDGEEALSVLADNDVDIIVSDAMMEPMGGFELCERVKNDVNYSHIPFILLTALTLDSAKVKGMESGADSYIEKPFSIQYLLGVIQNHLRTRDNMRRLYAASPFAQLDASAVSKADEQFVSNLQKVVSDNLADSEFDISRLSEEMGMSRTNLNRKIKGMFNLTPSNYIKVERLKRAAQLMKAGNNRINEVSYLVGFSSPSYFTQCFQRQFGLLPKDFIGQEN